MSSPATRLPSFKELEAALRTTTEFLARELGRPGQHAPHWNELEWHIAEAVAALHGISALLSEQLQWRGPERWQTFLAGQKAQTELRQQCIAELLSRIDARTREEGIGVLGMKGAALLGSGVYRSGLRPMGDVDLLVHGADVEAAGRVLTSIGYAASFETWRHKTFIPRDTPVFVSFGEHVANPIHIELHTRIVERLPFFDTDITALALPVRLRAGLNPYPGVAALMRHLLLHAAGNMRARALRLLQLHDIALLASRMSAADWTELLDAAPEHRDPWWAFPPLALSARYYPDAIPARVIELTRRTCASWLRRVSRRHTLSDVSWSKLRIQAFPGIEWSRSPREALRFAMSRVWPSHEALADLSHVPSIQPTVGEIPWYGLSHASRIVRWTFSRPPRVQTMLSVRCALGHEPRDALMGS